MRRLFFCDNSLSPFILNVKWFFRCVKSVYLVDDNSGYLGYTCR